MGGAKHYTDLVVWQLADAVRVEAFKFTRREPFNRDFKLQSQTEDAIDSVCRNTAEGFGCQSHREFARFLEIARRSLNEVMDCLRSAQLKGYVTEADVKPIRQLSARLYPALGRFMAYLRKTGTKERDRDRTNQREKGRTDHRQRDSTDKREQDRTDHRQRDSTDKREQDRTDHRQRDSTDKREQDRTDERQNDRTVMTRRSSAD
jgi:four helix bundle protein